MRGFLIQLSENPRYRLRYGIHLPNKLQFETNAKQPFIIIFRLTLTESGRKYVGYNKQPIGMNGRE